MLTGNSRPNWVKWQNPFFDLAFPCLTIGLLAVQYYTVRRLGTLTRDTQEGIKSTLMYGVEILATKARVDDKQVRGHCHLYESGKLVPIAYFTRGFQKDSCLSIPVSDRWFVVSNAFISSDIRCDNVNWRTTSPLSGDIWRNVQGVIACPIKPFPDQANPQASSTHPIGVISFDSAKTCEQMGWMRKRLGRAEIDGTIQEAMTALAAVAYVFIQRDLGGYDAR